MTFTLTITCDNAAFTDGPANEIARILRDAADKLESGKDWIPLLDYNGNRVGVAEFIDAE